MAPKGALAPAPGGAIPNAIAENSFTGGAAWGARALLYCEGEAPNRGFSRFRLTITAAKTRLPSSMLLARLRGDAGVMRHRGAKRQAAARTLAPLCRRAATWASISWESPRRRGSGSAAWGASTDRAAAQAASAGCERKSSGGGSCI